MVRLAPMFTKILLTALVVVGAALALRMRKRPQRAVVRPDANSTVSGTGFSLPQAAAYAVLLVMLLASGYFVYRQWNESWKVVEVHVINAGSGREVTYQAYKGDIEDRSFKTTDGRIVRLAEVERMELGGR